MPTLRTLVLVGAAAGVAAVLACQSYEFEKVDPVAIERKETAEKIVGMQKPAKIMIVLDKSGSMRSKPEDSVYGCCTTGNGTANSCAGYEPGGSCKWNSIKSLLLGAEGFLDQTADKARLGLAVFPHKEANTPDPENPGRYIDPCKDGYIPTPVASVEGQSNQTIKDLLGGTEITPNGGTPTAAILEAVGNDAEFMREEEATRRYAVLITDGLPNCNSKISQCKACTNTAQPTDNPPCGGLINCIDDDRVVTAVRTLKTKGVDTFVIGFGADTNSEAAKAVLNEAAVAGGQAQSEDAATRYYQAGNEADLQAILNRIIAKLQECTFSLQTAPPAENLLEISIVDTETETTRVLVRDTDWKYEGDGLAAIALQDDDASCAGVTIDESNPPEHCWCKLLQSATPNRFELRFNLVQVLK